MHGLIDSHFHLLEMQKKGLDVEELLGRLHASSWGGGIDIGVAPEDLASRHALASAYPEIRLAAGSGPWIADSVEPVVEIVARLEQHTAGIPFDFIGEIGLDYHWNYGTPARQRDLFEAQILFALRLGKPVIIHNRDADADMQAILRAHQWKDGGIMHCFSSSEELLECALDAGFCISFAGPITYRKNSRLRELLARVPLQSLLLETDSPYLSPEPFRGRPNTPLRMQEIYDTAARVRCMDRAELIEAIRINFDRLCDRS